MIYLKACLFIIIILIDFLCSAPAKCNPASSSECVVLLHGLARTSASMNKIEKRMSEAGYAVINVDYPSRRKKN